MTTEELRVSIQASIRKHAEYLLDESVRVEQMASSLGASGNGTPSAIVTVDSDPSGLGGRTFTIPERKVLISHRRKANTSKGVRIVLEENRKRDTGLMPTREIAILATRWLMSQRDRREAKGPLNAASAALCKLHAQGLTDRTKTDGEHWWALKPGAPVG